MYRRAGLDVPVTVRALGCFVAAKCPGFSWDRVNFLLSSCCVLDFVQEEC